MCHPPPGERKRECMRGRERECVCAHARLCVRMYVYTHTCTHTHCLSPVRKKGRGESREHHLNVPTSVRLQLTLFSPEINTQVTCLAFSHHLAFQPFPFLSLSQRRISHYGLSHYVLYKYNRGDYRA